jgi:hypothetical protein
MWREELLWLLYPALWSQHPTIWHLFEGGKRGEGGILKNGRLKTPVADYTYIPKLVSFIDAFAKSGVFNEVAERATAIFSSPTLAMASCGE